MRRFRQGRQGAPRVFRRQDENPPQELPGKPPGHQPRVVRLPPRPLQPAGHQRRGDPPSQNGPHAESQIHPSPQVPPDHGDSGD